MRKVERDPLSTPGDFYVENHTCTSCMAPHSEAPELMGHDEQTGCYFKRQPETDEEIEHAVQAIRVSCVKALRYSGNNPKIIERLKEVYCPYEADVLDKC